MYNPAFTITNKILKNIGIIEACKEVIDHAPLLPYYEKEFRKDALVRTVHYGTHIEGNELNFTQAEKVLEGQEIMARDRDIQEVINYREAMNKISKYQISSVRQVFDSEVAQIFDSETQIRGTRGAQDKYQIDEETIKEIHKITVQKILNQEQSGNYRKNQVVIKNSRTGEVSFKPPEPELVKPQIDDFLAYLNNQSSQDIHPVLKSGIVHYELARIHPFVDGNGRVARAMSTLILFLDGYDIRKFFSLEEYFDKSSENYYQALQSVAKDNGDLTRWLEYFTEGLAIELSKIKDKVEKISVDAKIREKLGGKPLMLTDRQLKIIEYIQETGYLQNQAFETLFPMVSEDTILNELRPLIQNGIIKKAGITKGARYIIS